MLTEAQGKYLFTFTLQVFESKPHCVCTGICLRDGVGFTQPTHCIRLLLEFIQRRLPILSDLQRARVCVIAAHQEQTIVFGCLLYLVYCVLRYKSYCVLYMYYCILVYLCICVVVFGHQGSAQQAAMSKDSRAKAISLLIQQRNVTPAKSTENKLPSKLVRNSQSFFPSHPIVH